MSQTTDFINGLVQKLANDNERLAKLSADLGDENPTIEYERSYRFYLGRVDAINYILDELYPEWKNLNKEPT